MARFIYCKAIRPLNNGQSRFLLACLSNGTIHHQSLRQLSISSIDDGNLNPTLAKYTSKSLADDFKHSIEDPQSFWAERAEHLDWTQRWDSVLDDTNSPFTKWFSGGKLNICHNALDRHVNSGHGHVEALVYDSPVTAHREHFTYAQMLEKVQKIAGMLTDCGVKENDRVLIYMPMIPEVASMLACARLGAVHIVVFGGFAATELAVRINHSKPRVILTASAGIEPSRVISYKPIVDEAIEKSEHKPQTVIVYRRHHVAVDYPLKKGRDLEWSEAYDKAQPFRQCVPRDANDPLYIIHTSGTTGLPKGVVRPCGGYAVVLPWSMRCIYGLQPGQVWWAATDLGWVVGHSYIAYAPFLAGITTVLFEGKPVGTPDHSAYLRVIDEHRVSSMFVAPTALRAIRQSDPDASIASHFPMKNLRLVNSAGEHLDHETRHWAETAFNVPVLDHWWQTESGWPISAPCAGYPDANMNPAKDSSGKPVPGFNVQLLSESTGARLTTVGALGRIVVKLPLPPGCLSTFWENDQKFAETYFKKFPGCYDTMDAGSVTDDGSVQVMSRVDDVINVSGHRLSSGALEEAILEHSSVVDSAVIGVVDALKGHVPVALCVTTDDFEGEQSDLCAEIVSLVRERVGAVAALKTVLIVPKLPKTRSGKIARNTLAAMAASKPYKIPVTIEDESVYPVILAVMRNAGLAGGNQYA